MNRGSIICSIVVLHESVQINLLLIRFEKTTSPERTIWNSAAMV